MQKFQPLIQLRFSITAGLRAGIAALAEKTGLSFEKAVSEVIHSACYAKRLCKTHHNYLVKDINPKEGEYKAEALLATQDYHYLIFLAGRHKRTLKAEANVLLQEGILRLKAAFKDPSRLKMKVKKLETRGMQ